MVNNMNLDTTYIDEIQREAYRKAYGQDYFSDRTLTEEVIPDGIILPFRRTPGELSAAGGVAYADGTYAENSAQRIVGAELDHGYHISVKECVKIDKTVMWFGAFHAHWGHFITEMVSRCWYLVQHKEDVKDLYIAYIRKSDSCDKQIYGNYLEFLELLGVNPDHLIEVTEPTQFTKVILPEASCRAGSFYTNEYKQIFDTVRDAVQLTTKTYDKLYFTRLKSKSFRRTELGEKRIAKLFRKNGFEIVAPEHLDLKEQIHLIKSCSELVVISGTLSHNILFAKDDVRITVINRDTGVNSYQPYMNQLRQAQMTYVDAHISLFPVFSNGPFLLHMTDNLKNYAMDHNMKYPIHSENAFSIHLKLAWYFFCYLDHMKSSDIKEWHLDEKFGKDIMGTYGYYRDRLSIYDEKKIKLFRKCFYILARVFE